MRNTAHLCTLAALVPLAAAGAAAAAPCTIERSSYALDGDAEHRLVFGLAAEPNVWSALAVTLTAKSGDRHDYGFANSNGYSFTYLVDHNADAALNESARIFFFDRNLRLLDLPQPGDAPPPLLFAPELGALLWYGGEGGGRAFLPVAMWRFAGCR